MIMTMINATLTCSCLSCRDNLLFLLLVVVLPTEVPCFLLLRAFPTDHQFLDWNDIWGRLRFNSYVILNLLFNYLIANKLLCLVFFCVLINLKKTTQRTSCINTTCSTCITWIIEKIHLTSVLYECNDTGTHHTWMWMKTLMRLLHTLLLSLVVLH